MPLESRSVRRRSRNGTVLQPRAIQEIREIQETMDAESPSSPVRRSARRFVRDAAPFWSDCEGAGLLRRSWARDPQSWFPFGATLLGIPRTVSRQDPRVNGGTLWRSGANDVGTFSSGDRCCTGRRGRPGNEALRHRARCGHPRPLIGFALSPFWGGGDRPGKGGAVGKVSAGPEDGDRDLGVRRPSGTLEDVLDERGPGSERHPACARSGAEPTS